MDDHSRPTFEQIKELFGRSIDDPLFIEFRQMLNEKPVYGMGVFTFASSGFCLYLENGLFKACLFDLTKNVKGQNNIFQFPFLVTEADTRMSIIEKLGDPIAFQVTAAEGNYPSLHRAQFKLDGLIFEFTFSSDNELVKSVVVHLDVD